MIVERYNVILSPFYSRVAAMRLHEKHGVYFSSCLIRNLKQLENLSQLFLYQTDTSMNTGGRSLH